jgi:Tol biopolymer transport system component
MVMPSRAAKHFLLNLLIIFVLTGCSKTASQDIVAISTSRPYPEGRVVLLDLKTMRQRDMPAPAELFAGQVAWSPDGSEIAFFCRLKAGTGLCHSEYPDGGTSLLLHANHESGLVAGAANQSVDWSPDGRQLLFIARTTDETELWGLYLLDMEKRQVSLLFEDQEELGPLRSLSWSSDGDIALQIGQSIYVLPRDSRTPQRLCEGEWPRWSPDGTQLAYLHQGDIYLVSVNLDQVRRVLESRMMFCASRCGLTWSPEGQHLLFIEACGESDRPALVRLDTNTLETDAILEDVDWANGLDWRPRLPQE